MIFRRILPTEGGAIRRFIRIRKTLFENSLQFESQQQSQQLAAELKPLQPMKPLNLIDFTNNDDAADAKAASIGNKNQNWRISDDEVIGGFSRGFFELHDDYDGDVDDDVRNMSNGSNDDASSSPSPSPKQPFARWEGNISTKIGPKSRAKRSGFCAIRCPEFLYSLPVGNKYNALEIQCRTDERHYTVNLKVQSFFPDDLYQSLITVKRKEVVETLQKQQLQREGIMPSLSNDDVGVDSDSDDDEDSQSSSPFVSVVLPFRDFVLTSHGMMKDQQRGLDGGMQLQHLGFTLMDEQDGPFRFDLQKIRLVNYDSREGIIMNDTAEDD
eukprot:scaffold2408_cov279-Chaetoceros_neogracile.AAC.5